MKRLGHTRAVASVALAGALLAGCAVQRGPAAGPGGNRIGPALRGEVVVLVHGLGRTPVSMLLLARRLERRGYRVVNWGYPSTTTGVAALGSRLGGRVRALRPAPLRVHFVGHSLGNVIIRWMLAHAPPEQTGRVVMLAPPNQGARAADRYAPWLAWLLRPLPELRTEEGSTARSLALPTGVEVGIIAGARDGKVTVAETRLRGARDHTTVPSAHSWIMNRRDVKRLIVRFLKRGSFAGSAEALQPSAPSAIRRCQ